MNTVRSEALRGVKTRIAASAFALLAAAPLALAGASPASAATLDRIRETGHIRLGYRTDARPLSFKDEQGKAAGYSIALCDRVVAAVKAEPGLAQIAVDWVPVTVEDRFAAVEKGEIDLLCGAETITLARRQQISFSIPVFSGGIAALVRSDASERMKDVLLGREPKNEPVWRGSTAQAMQAKNLAVVGGTTGESWLAEKINEFKLAVQTKKVGSYDAGVRELLDRKADVLFGDRVLLYGAAESQLRDGKLVLLERFFTVEPIAFGLARGDDDFRLVVDRALSRVYGSAEWRKLFTAWFGEPDQGTLGFFRSSAQPE